MIRGSVEVRRPFSATITVNWYFIPCDENKKSETEMINSV
jgi:hypothetical protein